MDMFGILTFLRPLKQCSLSRHTNKNTSRESFSREVLGKILIGIAMDYAAAESVEGTSRA
jgi:hypothetical protein